MADEGTTTDTTEPLVDGTASSVIPAGDKTASDALQTTTQEKTATEVTDKSEGTLTADATKTSKAPEKYELTLPEGSYLKESAVEKTASIAKERGLSNEEAQFVLEQSSRAVEDHLLDAQAVTEGWIAEVKSDKEIGGEHFNKSVESAKRVIERFATDEFKNYLNETKFGNHPEVVRTFARIGRAMEEDSLIMPKGTPAANKKSPEELFYGTTTSKKE